MKLRRLRYPAIALALLAVLSPLRAGTFGEAVTNSPPDTSADAAAATAEDAATQKLNDTPHFWQRDSRGGFANEGRDYCCPVAVSNSLVYFARHGFPALLPGSDDTAQSQIDLINLLASSDYFGTDPENGTAPGSVLSGVQKYIEEKGYQCRRLEYEGWRNVGSAEAATVKAARPDLDWLSGGVTNPHGAVWLNIGWYREITDGEWKRTGGHWVTLVGVRPGEADGDPPIFLIHNPATRGNGDQPDDPDKDVVYLKAVDSGTLDTGKTSTEDASGMYQLSGPGLPIAKGVDAAFLDAAIVVVVAPN
jgi:hypothetical protein